MKVPILPTAIGFSEKTKDPKVTPISKELRESFDLKLFIW
jgi:hypothetical protein